MKRIFFVDDDVNILRALERMLWRFRHDWECRFIGNAREALDMLATERPDVLVSDMRMPGIDGAELLSESLSRHPSMARFILSGEVGHSALLRILGVAHQCIGKPCKAEVLTGLLARTFRLQERFKSVGLREGVHRLAALPVLPRLHEALREAVVHAKADEREARMLDVFERTPGMASTVLQVATWTRLDSGSEIASLREAVQSLGSELVMAIASSDALRPLADPQITAFQERVWRECEGASLLAGAIARAEQCSDDEVGEATVAALLSCAGALLLDATCRDEYASLRSDAGMRSVGLPDLERQHFGVTQTEAAACLFELWGLSGRIVNLVACSEQPNAMPTDRLGPAGAAHMAMALMRSRDGLALPARSLEYLDRLGLVDRLPVWENLAAETGSECRHQNRPRGD